MAKKRTNTPSRKTKAKQIKPKTTGAPSNTSKKSHFEIYTEIISTLLKILKYVRKLKSQTIVGIKTRVRTNMPMFIARLPNSLRRGITLNI